MGYKIINGVDAPAGRKKYDFRRAVLAIEKLDIADSTAVKIIFEEKTERGAFGRFASDLNKANGKAWRYFVQCRDEENGGKIEYAAYITKREKDHVGDA